jgi:hypothetical protein
MGTRRFVISVDSERSLKQREIEPEEWYVQVSRFRGLLEEGLSERRFTNRLRMLIRKQIADDLWAETWMGTKVYGYPGEAVYPVVITVVEDLPEIHTVNSTEVPDDV